MSKKKNTLKDLDEFLKQQAATLVTPEALNPGEDSQPLAKVPATVAAEKAPSLEEILQDLKTLSGKDGDGLREKLYDLILLAAGQGYQSAPEDKMLINTVLYLKNREHWKDAIRAYWRNKG
ncbi:MAG TPA: hypothetical protein VD816_12200 [Ohtaekwangia sp.]|nr:hypothetical protein [Ohtaekwangia sp.]